MKRFFTFFAIPQIRISVRLAVLFALILISGNGFGQVAITETFTGGTGNITIPSNVASVIVQCWGGGGGGNGRVGAAAAGGGGGGGAFATATVTTAGTYSYS